MYRFMLLVAGLGLASLSYAQMPDDPQHRLFETSDKCLACHNGLTTSSGEDVSIGHDWRGSMMANASRDPYWQAAVRREVMDHPKAQAQIEDECAACHMPMSRYQAKANGELGRIFTHLPFPPEASHQTLLAEDGVSCSACHQITDRNLGEPESFTGGFHVDTETLPSKRQILGPFEVESGLQEIMRSTSGFTPQQGKHLQRSELCATCHTLYTHTLGEGGQVVGELPEQVPYLEWRHSDFPGKQSCQSCHMPVVQEETPMTSVLGEPRQGLSRHTFRGGNFFMLRMLNRYGNELGVKAPPEALNASVERTLDYLRNGTARLELQARQDSEGKLEATVAVTNLAGHKLPTAYPSRRAWIHLQVRDASGELVFESGRFTDDGAIVGNDNDLDATRYEPHYQLIEHPEQVQVYEAIMATPNQEVTTGLLSAVSFIKDNRLLPRGFNKATAGADIAVQGRASEDDDFAGGQDRVRYRVAVSPNDGPFQVEAQLWYQPIAYRWAQNLAAYDAQETNRFVRMYQSMAADSAVVLEQAVTGTR
ncbi:hypothetical protein GPM19_13235 [Halomonas sp. ZH2S]|uniref:Cytochrome c-552/4 domain-containing protein n=1 Tax=Vreelandella zhuhanensis TaxID=2684210 RepID=A0A7X3KSA0_9GAMM|nr:hypothetical protein [Halomonas zhuhanensis]MWJ29146.1 hypothetical protein [Halomonas zhuhanensis]